MLNCPKLQHFNNLLINSFPPMHTKFIDLTNKIILLTVLKAVSTDKLYTFEKSSKIFNEAKVNEKNSR